MPRGSRIHFALGGQKMFKTLLVGTLLCIVNWPFNTISQACTFDGSKQLISDHKTARHEIWTLKASKELFQYHLPKEPSFTQYQRWANKMFAPIDSLRFLKRGRASYSRYRADVKRYDDVLSGQVGSITAINCLQAIIFSAHNKMRPLNVKPSEFVAYIFRKHDQLKVIFSSQTVLSPNSSIALLHAKNLHQKKWNLLAHIHNHPFIDKTSGGDVMASGEGGSDRFGDIGVFLKLHNQMALQEAWVTNGFHTLILRKDDFQKIEQWKY